jgi:hypothetical protein
MRIVKLSFRCNRADYRNKTIGLQIICSRAVAQAIENSEGFKCHAIYDETSVIEPPDLSTAEKKIWLELCSFSDPDMLQRCMKTDLQATATFSSWREFVKAHRTLQTGASLRECADLLLQVLCRYAPDQFNDL